MTRHDEIHARRRNFDEIIRKFKNGEERYHKSPELHAVVHSLVNGADPYEIIDKLIQLNENTKELLHKTLNP